MDWAASHLTSRKAHQGAVQNGRFFIGTEGQDKEVMNKGRIISGRSNFLGGRAGDLSCRLGNSGVLGLLLGNVETAVKLDIEFWFVLMWGLAHVTPFAPVVCFYSFFFFWHCAFLLSFFLMKNVYLELLITVQETDLGKTWRVFQGRESQGLIRA